VNNQHISQKELTASTAKNAGRIELPFDLLDYCFFNEIDEDSIISEYKEQRKVTEETKKKIIGHRF